MATGPKDLSPENTYGKEVTYTKSYTPRGGCVRTFRRGGEGRDNRDVGIMWYATEVTYQDSPDVETYEFRTLEEAMDHHNSLLENESTYLGEERRRFTAEEVQLDRFRDIESED